MKKRLRGRLGSGNFDDNVNPMDGVANLADVMIVLAVGIMLALIINWNLDIGAIAYTKDNTQSVDIENAIALDSDSIEEVDKETEQIDSEDMEKLGSVYFDETTGKYYIIVD